MKTLVEWNKSGKCLNDFLTIGDRIDMALVDYFIGVLPPKTMRHNVIQMGEAFDGCPETGKTRWLTIFKLYHVGQDVNIDGDWVYEGPRTSEFIMQTRGE